jgi:hypothetical protein
MVRLYLINHTKKQYVFVGYIEEENEISTLFTESRWTLEDEVTLRLLEKKSLDKYRKRNYVDANDLVFSSDSENDSDSNTKDDSDNDDSDNDDSDNDDSEDDDSEDDDSDNEDDDSEDDNDDSEDDDSDNDDNEDDSEDEANKKEVVLTPKKDEFENLLTEL